MSEIAEKELAGEIYLATQRLNELMHTASRLHKMRTEIQSQDVTKTGFVPYGHVVVTVYKFMERET